MNEIASGDLQQLLGVNRTALNDLAKRDVAKVVHAGASWQAAQRSE